MYGIKNNKSNKMKRVIEEDVLKIAKNLKLPDMSVFEIIKGYDQI
jgi:hypothetical protein